MVAPTGDWNWQLIQHLLPHLVLLRIATIRPPFLQMGSDNIGWRGGMFNPFSVKASYETQWTTPRSKYLLHPGAVTSIRLGEAV
ncbi:hypothetical protein V6N12_013284 [Hibiscus sabdariffa]|uniref:Uncharacterized protein n=1 Tax=Hibiscus sabdariffa TaxID=183260 RepID=A0ABR2D6W7_9ROSI